MRLLWSGGKTRQGLLLFPWKLWSGKCSVAQGTWSGKAVVPGLGVTPASAFPLSSKRSKRDGDHRHRTPPGGYPARGCLVNQLNHIDESGQTTRGQAPVSAVSVLNYTVYGGSLIHSLDYVVLLHLMFATAAGRSLTPPELWAELKKQGIRSSKNSNELVGKNAVYESFARLITVGFVRRVELVNEKHPGRKGRIAYEVFDNPAWNPDWKGYAPSDADQLGDQAEKKPQVRMLPGTPEVVNGEAGETAGQNASRNAGSGVQGTGVPGRGTRVVPAGQNASAVPGSIKASPPHPPVSRTQSQSLQVTSIARKETPCRCASFTSVNGW